MPGHKWFTLDIINVAIGVRSGEAPPAEVGGFMQRRVIDNNLKAENETTIRRPYLP